MSDRPGPVLGRTAHRQPSPFRLNLEQQRKRAKELLRDLRSGEADAVRRFMLHHPQIADGAPPDRLIRLSEAQLVVARELGLPSWPRLKAHIQRMEQSWDRILQHEVAPDSAMATLHLRCGSDIGPTLKQAGFAGDFLEYSDPLCQGPVIGDPAWLERRAQFVAESYGARSGQSIDRIAVKLAAAEEALKEAAARYQRVVLWFEHDSYDQLILARCLAQFAAACPRHLELISPPRYPGATRFIGLGQLPPEALRLLWDERAPVSAAAMQAGQAVWNGLRSPDPSALAARARAGTGDLPQLAGAVQRHCRELPWTRDGLSLTERLILQVLVEGPRSMGQVFSQIMMEREPLPWMSDLIFRSIIESMKRVDRPVFTSAFDGEDLHWPEERLTITRLGQAVLAGQVDWLALRPPARWLGGVFLPGMMPCWRWDDATASVVMA